MLLHRSLPSLAVVVSLTLAACASSGAPGGEPLDMRVDLPSLLPVAFDGVEGAATLTLPAADDLGVRGTFLLVEGIETGLGANEVGLDRGAMGGAKLVRFRSVGGKILLEEINTSFRAEKGSAAEKEAARQSFATSVLWGTDEVEPGPGGSVNIDLTSFLVRDAHGIATTLARTGQGSYSLDAARSALDVGRCRAFPRNLEFAAVLTFQSDKPGSEARATAPEGGALTFVQRQGLVALPDGDYRRRRFDPRMGAFGVSFLDYSTGLADPTAQRLAVRHRIERDPRTGEPVPIVYYVDRAAPEPVRSALVEGASWWESAFAAAGYPGLFRVEVAPRGLDPLDTRFNVIQWVHRSTRGWSYGNALSDPRTGEILKGHVSLGSLRVRQDRLLFEGLLGVAKTGSGDADDPVQLALARIRQLAAHEVGHTLGLAHNFAASVANRASVMDYPAPRVRPAGNGGLDVSDAYGIGIGEWDKHAIRMLYGEVAAGETVSEFHDRLSAEVRSKGILYLTDADARSAGAAHPLANLWDDGSNPTEGLENALAVRRTALDRFGAGSLQAGRPLAELEEVFVPVYLHHRYQLDGAIKMVGGTLFEHGVNRPRATGAVAVPADEQRRALDVILGSLSPENLSIPASVRSMLLPRPPGYGRSRETFQRRAGDAFDPLGAADVIARQVARGLMNPERLMRVVLQSAASEGLTVEETVQALMEVGRPQAGEAGEAAALRVVVLTAALEELMGTAGRPNTPREVRNRLVTALRVQVETGRLSTQEDLLREAKAFLDRPVAAQGTHESAGPEAPPGSPIGAGVVRKYEGCASPGWLESGSYRR